MKKVVFALLLWAACPFEAVSRSLPEVDSFAENGGNEKMIDDNHGSIFADAEWVDADGSPMVSSHELQKWFLQTLIKNKDRLGDFDGRELLPSNEWMNKTSTTTRKLGEISMKRHLAPEDWTRFNEVFRNARLNLPTIDFPKQKVAGFDLRLGIQNPFCYNFYIEDMTMSVFKMYGMRVHVVVDVKGVHVDCESQYSYRWGAFGNVRGSGTVNVRTRDNSLYFGMRMISDHPNGLAGAPPNRFVITDSTANFGIHDLDFKGGIVAKILDASEKLMRNFLEEKLEQFGLEELESFGLQFIQDSVAHVTGLINHYLQPIPASRSNPLTMENEYLSRYPDTSGLIDFKNLQEGSVAEMVAGLLGQADELLGTVVEDPTSETGYDLGINGVIRRTMLHHNRAAYLHASWLQELGMDFVLFQAHDKISQTEVKLNRIQIFGLDTFSQFDPLVDIGRFTLENEFHLDHLQVVMEVTLTIKPSSLPDRVFENANGSPIQENVELKFGLDNLDVAFSLLAVLDEEKMLDIEMGSILRPEEMLTCIADMIRAVRIAGLDVSIGNLHEPVLSGIVSKGIDLIMTDAMHAIFLSFEPTVLKAIGNIFETDVRDMLDKFLTKKIGHHAGLFTCVWNTNALPSTLDFRDLLLDPEAALALGGSGAEPYGSVLHVVYGLLLDEFKKVKEPGTLGFNDFVVEPFLPGGEYITNSSLISFEMSPEESESRRLDGDAGLDLFKDLITGQIDFNVGNVKLSHVNTVVNPLVAIEPSNDESTLQNEINLGGTGLPDVTVSLVLDMLVEGPSALALDDSMKFTVSASSAEFIIDLIARLESLSFLGFPIRHMTDFNCWLAILPLSDGTEENLSFENLAIQINNLFLQGTVVSGSSPGIQAISSALAVVQETGATSLLGDRLESVFLELLESDMVGDMLDNKITEGRAKCPISPSYDPEFGNDFNRPAPFEMSLTSIDTFLFGTLLVVNILEIAIFENHMGYRKDDSSVRRLDARSEGILDWTNLSELGFGDLADEGFQMARDYLEGSDDDGDLNINDIVRQISPSTNGTLSFQFDELSLDMGDLLLSVDSIELSALDTFSQVQVLSPVSPQVLSNSFSLDGISLNVELSAKSISTNETIDIKMVYAISGLNVTIDVHAGFVIQELLDVSLGSLLSGEDGILSCLLSTASTVEVDSFVVNMESMSVPVVTGLLAESGESMDLTLEALYDEFMDDILEALPILTNTTLKQVTNNYLASLVAEAECNLPSLDSSEGSFLPVSYLFDDSTTFGSMLPAAYDLFQTYLASENSMGLSSFNDFIEPLTKQQSGIKGTVSFVGSLFDFATSTLHRIGIQTLGLSLSDAMMKNLNTVESPVTLLHAPEPNSSMLENRMIIGKSSPIELLSTLSVAVSGDPLLSSINDLLAGIELNAAELFASVRAEFHADGFLNFPIREATNVYCWLALFGAPELDMDGFRVLGDDRGLILEDLQLGLDSMTFRAACRDGGKGCSTSGIPLLQSILMNLDSGEATAFLKDRVLLLLQEIASGPFLQTFIDRVLVEAADQCSLVNRSSLEESYPSPPLPVLTDDMLDTVLFTVAYAFEAAIVLVFESHSSYLGAEVDPLQAQKDLDPAGKELIDFSDLTLSVGSWAATAVDQLRSFAEGKTDGKLGVQQLFAIAFLDESNVWSFDLTEYEWPGAVNISLRELNLTGLDTLSDASLLNMIGPQTIQNELTVDYFKAELGVTVVTEEADVDAIVRLELENVQVNASVLLAINKVAFGDMELGRMLNSSAIFNCIFEAIHSIDFPFLDVSVGDILSFEIDGVHNPAVSAAIESMTAITLASYKDVLIKNFPSFVNFSLKAVLNNYIEWFFDKGVQKLECSNDWSSQRRLEQSASEIFSVDFRDLILSPEMAVPLGGRGTEQYGDMIRKLVDALNENILKIDPDTGLSDINSILISKFTESQSNVSGKFVFEGDLVNGGTRIQLGGLDLEVELRVFDGYLDGLDTIGSPFSLLDPVLNKPSNLNNTATMGLGEDMKFGARVYLSIIDNSGQEIINDLDVSLSFSQVHLMLEALLRLSEDRFYSFQLRDLVSTDCLLTMMPAPVLDRNGVRLEGEIRSAGLEDLAMSVAQMELDVKCVGQCSPGMEDFAELLKTPEATESSTEIANSVFDYVTGLLGGEYLQVSIDRIINEAHRNCPSSSSYVAEAAPLTYEPFTVEKQEDSIQFLLMLAIAAGCITVALLIVTSSVKIIVLWRHRMWLRTLSHRDLENLMQGQAADFRKKAAVNESSKPMFLSNDIPLWVRISMPFIILGNIGFFLSGHLSLGATVNIVASLGGSSLTVDKFFEFSIMKSTIEIWNAGGTELAIMLLIFSVLWPYVKQGLTLFLWFAPPKIVSVARRGSFLIWLDTLAKWSIVDIFTLVLTVAAFRVSIQSPDVAFLPEGFYSIDLIVVPLWGLYANMIAQLISQISSHYIIHYHRRIEERAIFQYELNLGIKSNRTLPIEDAEEPSVQSLSIASNDSSQHEDQTEDRLCSHAFERPHRTSRDRLLVKRFMHPMVVIAGVVVSILVLLGCMLNSFSVEILGFIGLFVESGQGFTEAKEEHSVFTILKMLMEQASFTGRIQDKIGLGSLAGLLLFSVLLVPIAQSTCLIYMWFGRMTKQRRKRIAVFVEILQAWQYSEVYLLSVIVTSWQLGPVSDFMINSYCTSLDDLFGQLVYYGVLKEEDAQCFRVEATVEHGSFVIAAGAAALALLNTYVMKAVIQYFRDSERASSESIVVAESVSGDDISYQSDTDTLARKIHPVPVLFTDKFRWFFVREDAVGSSPTVIQVNETDSQSAVSSVTEKAKFPASSKISKGFPVSDISVGNSSSSEASVSIQLDPVHEGAMSAPCLPRRNGQPSNIDGETLPDNGESQTSSYLPENLCNLNEPVPTNFEFMMDTLLDENLEDESSA